MQILFTDRRTSRDNLEQVITEEAEKLGLKVELREPDQQVKQQVLMRHLIASGEMQERSGGPFNAVPPELIEVAVLSAKSAAVTGGGTAGTLAVTGLWKAVAAKVRDRNLAKAERVDAEKNRHRYHQLVDLIESVRRSLYIQLMDELRAELEGTLRYDIAMAMVTFTGTPDELAAKVDSMIVDHFGGAPELVGKPSFYESIWNVGDDRLEVLKDEVDSSLRLWWILAGAVPLGESRT